jgi:uncharacterized protein YuzE
MKVTLDRSTDSAYIYLTELEVEGTVKPYTCDPIEVNGQINLDFDSSGRLVGIEVLDAKRLLPEELLKNAEIIG